MVKPVEKAMPSMKTMLGGSDSRVAGAVIVPIFVPEAAVLS